jgi:hypothetical protein
MLIEEFNYISIKLSQEVDKFNNDTNAEFLFIDIREPEEIEKYKNKFDAITLFIKKDNCEKISSNMSDANVENYDYDYIIENNGNLNDLECKAITFINILKKEYNNEPSR